MRRLPAPGSLRGRLTVGSMLLVAVGLVAADATAFLAVRDSLNDRIDQNLMIVADRGRAAAVRTSEAPLTAGTISRLLPSDVVVALYDAGGRQVLERDTLTGPASAPPALTGVGEHPTTLAAGSDGGLRAVAIDLPASQPLRLRRDGTTYEVTRLVVGISRASDVATLRRLLRVEVLSGLVIMAVALLAGRAVLRSGLAPLRTVATTALQIGRGDLARRLPVGDRQSEIGAVSAALNTAFEQREISELRLRRFVADASHELRTPVSIIHGWADLYSGGHVDDWEEVDSIMTTIRNESERMGHLVEQLLTLARLDAHEPLQPTRLDVTELCAQAVADLDVIADSHPIRVEAAGSVHVSADEEALRRVVGNLLSNALRHTPPGTAVELRVDPARDGGVDLAVVDHGPGLEQGDVARAFDRFWRSDARRSTPGGSGLGLAITRDLVLVHGGTIELAPTSGGGLSVHIHLPDGLPASDLKG